MRAVAILSFHHWSRDQSQALIQSPVPGTLLGAYDIGRDRDMGRTETAICLIILWSSVPFQRQEHFKCAYNQISGSRSRRLHTFSIPTPDNSEPHVPARFILESFSWQGVDVPPTETKPRQINVIWYYKAYTVNSKFITPLSFTKNRLTSMILRSIILSTVQNMRHCYTAYEYVQQHKSRLKPSLHMAWTGTVLDAIGATDLSDCYRTLGSLFKRSAVLTSVKLAASEPADGFNCEAILACRLC